NGTATLVTRLREGPATRGRQASTMSTLSTLRRSHETAHALCLVLLLGCSADRPVFDDEAAVGFDASGTTDDGNEPESTDTEATDKETEEDEPEAETPTDSDEISESASDPEEPFGTEPTDTSEEV